MTVLKNLKAFVKGMCPLQNDTRHSLFPVGERGKHSHRKVQARLLVKNRGQLKALVTACPEANLPVSLLADIIVELDEYYGNRLSNGKALYEVTDYALGEAIAGCQQYGWLRKLTRDTRRSRNAHLRDLKSCVVLKNDHDGDLPMISSSSAGSNGSEAEDNSSDCETEPEVSKDDPERSPKADAVSVSEEDAAAPPWFARLCKEDRVNLAKFLTFNRKTDLTDLMHCLTSAWQVTPEQISELQQYLFSETSADESEDAGNDAGDKLQVDQCLSTEEDAGNNARGDHVEDDAGKDARGDHVEEDAGEEDVGEYSGCRHHFSTEDPDSRAEGDTTENDLASEGEAVAEDVRAVADADSEGDGGMAEMGTQYPLAEPHWGHSQVVKRAIEDLGTEFRPKRPKPVKPAAKTSGKAKRSSKAKSSGKAKGRCKGSSTGKTSGKAKGGCKGSSTGKDKDAWHALWKERHRQELNTLPQECLPRTSIHGEKSWTLHSKSGDAAIEVLLHCKAFYIKKVAPGHSMTDQRPTMSWMKMGPEKTWENAKQIAGFDV